MNNLEQQPYEAGKNIVPPPSPFDDFDFDRIRAEAVADRPFGGTKVTESHDFSSDQTVSRLDAAEKRRTDDKEAAKKILAEIRGGLN